MNYKVGSDVAGSVSSSEISSSSGDNSLVAQATSINSEIETVCGVCSTICGWSTLESGWIIMDDSPCSINPDLLITFGIRVLSPSSWLGVYSGGFPWVLCDHLGNSATIKNFNTQKQRKIQTNPKVAKETIKMNRMPIKI